MAIRYWLVKQDPKLEDLPMIKQTRLSVTPLTPAQFNHIIKVSKTNL